MTDLIKSARELAEAATSGPWFTEKPVATAQDMFAPGIIVAAVAPRMGIYADPPSGSFPANDRRFIAASRDLVPALCDEVERLRTALELIECDNTWHSEVTNKTEGNEAGMIAHRALNPQTAASKSEES